MKVESVLTHWSISRRRIIEISLKAGGLIAAPAALFGKPNAIRGKAEPNQLINDMLVASDQMVEMSDGVKLAADIYRPAHDGVAIEHPLPVLLIRTPYNKQSFSERTADKAEELSVYETAKLYVKRGYVLVIQDCRGRFKSEGEFKKYIFEGPDGVDTCRWIQRQSWCNGKIGTFGGSYLAHAQSAMAALSAPGLSAMFLDCGGFSNGFTSGIRQGGAFELKQVTWAFSSMLDSPGVAGDALKQAQIKAINLKDWMLSLPWKRGHSPLSVVPAYENYVFDQWEQGTFGPFWQQPSIYWRGYYDASHAAAVHLSGWYDPYTLTATENYLGQRQLGRDVSLIMGPWTHTATETTYSGDVEFGKNASLMGNLSSDYPSLRLAFFDRTLKGKKSTAPAPRVQIFVMGGGSGHRNEDGRIEHGGAWRTESDWPIPDQKLTPYYLQSGGGLDLKPGQGQPHTFRFDPDDPVPTIGGSLPGHEPWRTNKGGYDQRETSEFFGAKEPYLPLAARPDVLVFQTNPLEEDVEITGDIVARLYVSSDCVDTDFTFKLIDVYPSNADYPLGYALNLTDGIIRTRYRKSWTQPSLLVPGDIAAIEITAFPTSNLFKRGHRIRIDISSSNFPRFDVNPNTGAPEATGQSRKIAMNTVFMDVERPSHVVLPVIPARAGGSIQSNS